MIFPRNNFFVIIIVFIGAILAIRFIYGLDRFYSKKYKVGEITSLEKLDHTFNINLLDQKEGPWEIGIGDFHELESQLIDERIQIEIINNSQALTANIKGIIHKIPTKQSLIVYDGKLKHIAGKRDSKLMIYNATQDILDYRLRVTFFTAIRIHKPIEIFLFIRSKSL